MNDFLDARVVLLMLGAIGGLLLLLGLRAQRQTTVEAGRTPLYKATGGGRIGFMKYRGPLVSLRLYEEFLVIRALQTIVLPYAAIESVQVEKWFGLVEDRIRIVHRDFRFPQTLVLSVSNPHQVKEIIDQRLAR